MDIWLLTKKGILLIVIALATRLFFFWLVADVKGEKGFLEGPDSGEYITIAHNILTHGVFSSDTAEHLRILGADTPRPDNFRMPLYPLFLASFLRFGAGISFIGLIQIFISTLTVLFVYLQGRKIFGERPAVWASFFIALYPYDAYFSSIIGNDPLFLVFSVPGVFFLLRFVREQKKHHLFAGALLLGIAALVRTTGLFFLLFIPLLWFFVPNFRTEWRRAFRETGTALAIAVLILSPWIVRNKIALNIWSLSSDGQFTLAYNSINHYYRLYLPQEKNVFDNENQNNGFLQSILAQDPNLRSYKNTSAIAREASRALGEYGWGYAFFHIRRAPVVLIDDGLIGLLNAFHVPIEQGPVSLRSAVRSLFSFDSAPLRTYEATLARAPLSLAGPLGIVLRLVILIFAIASIILPESSGLPRRIRFFILCMIGAYALALPLYGLHRHRMPVDPFLLLLASYTVITVITPKSVKDSLPRSI